MNFYEAYANQPTFHNNEMYICGQNQVGSAYGNGALMKLNQYGDTIWTKQYDLGAGSTFANVLSLTDSDIFVSGVYQTTPSSTDALVLKVDSSGNIKWQNTIGGAGSEIVLKADTLSASRYLFSGYKSYTASGFTDAWMCLLDSAGAFIQQKTFGYSSSDGGFVKVINNDTILFYGVVTRNGFSGSNSPLDGFAILCDANLNFLDTIIIESPGNYGTIEAFQSVEVSFKREYILIGNYRASSSDDILGHLICLDKSLNIKWERKFKARENDNYFTDIALMPDGGYIISGYVFPDGSGTTQDGWLVRTNCLGWLSKPIPQFTAFNTGNNTVRFHNYSKFAEKYTWDFGDGWQYTHATSLQDSLSSVPYVEHTYTTPGTYTATLYAIACGDTMTISQTIVADPVSVTEANEQKIKVYPNPTGGNAFIESPNLANYHTLQVFNDAGQWVYSSSITPNATNRLEIPSSTWANGIYVVTLEGAERVEKVVLMKTE
jgi:PKD repeat protein